MQALSLTQCFDGGSVAGRMAGAWIMRRGGQTAWTGLVVLCPGGVGRQKLSIVFKTVPLRMLGAWGKRKASELVLGRAPANPSPAIQYFMEFLSLIHKNLRPRMVKLPIFSDACAAAADDAGDGDPGRQRRAAGLGGNQASAWSATSRMSRFATYPEAGHFIPVRPRRFWNSS